MYKTFKISLQFIELCFWKFKTLCCLVRNIRGREYEGVDTEIEEVLRVNLTNNQTDQVLGIP